MRTFYFIRHGETKANQGGILQGQSDIPLSMQGRRQARALAEALKDVRFDAIYSSDLSRAMETAKAVAVYHDCRVIPDTRLREINCGELEGKTMAQCAQQFPEYMKRLKESPLDAIRPGGESYRDLISRVQEAFNDICRNHPEGTVAIVAHGGTLRALVACVTGETVDPSSKSMANCSVTVAVCEGSPHSWKITKHNDVSHLMDAGIEDNRDKAEAYRW